MDYSHCITQVRTFWRLRHDGYTHRHYSSPLFMVSKPCLDLIKKGDHDIIGGSIAFGPIVTRRDTIRFWLRQARLAKPN